jgi:trans-aconitate 2-methyltransferase
MAVVSGAWSPEQYLRFREERRQPFLDLLAMVDREPGMRIADLGCGTGDLTRHLHTALGARETIGVDTSPEMLAKAEGHRGRGLGFVQDDLATYGEGERFDLVISNAALHWVADHPTLFARLARRIRPGGQLAVQVPYNFDQPSHLAANLAAQDAPFQLSLGGYVKPVHVLRPEHYAKLLHDLGFQRSILQMRVYQHLLPSRDDIVQWVKGTTLTDYEKRLPPDLFDSFVEHYRERLFELVGDERPLLFTFNRILMWARRSAQPAQPP